MLGCRAVALPQYRADSSAFPAIVVNKIYTDEYRNVKRLLKQTTNMIINHNHDTASLYTIHLIQWRTQEKGYILYCSQGGF